MTQLTVLGSSTCVSSFNTPFDFRNPPGYLLTRGKLGILLDCSEGIRSRLEQLKYDYYNLSHIFISHYHPDHFNLESIIQSLFVRSLWGKTKKSITIYGPSDIEERFKLIWNQKHYPHFYQESMHTALNITFVPFHTEQSIKLEQGVTCTPFAVFHEGGKMECYTLRFQIGTSVFTYSGDTGECTGIIAAATDADLFLCEASTNIGDDKSKTAGHLNPRQAGDIAHKAGVKHLMLTHYTGKDSVEDMRQDVATSGFSNKITIAHDYQVVTL